MVDDARTRIQTECNIQFKAIIAIQYALACKARGQFPYHRLH